MLIILNFVQFYILNVLIIFIILSLFIIKIHKNPVFSIFNFVMTSFLIFIFLLLLGAEFFALLILIIYIGVILVLFLFVVIMYNLQIKPLTLFTYHIVYSPFIIFLGLKIYIILILWSNYFNLFIPYSLYQTNKIIYTLDIIYFTNLFNEQYILFFFAGMLLFISLIGSICITYPFVKFEI